MAYIGDSTIMVTPAGSLIDASGRLRVSQLTSQLDIKHLTDKLPDIISEVVSGSASSTFSASAVDMVVSANNAYVVRQTFQHASYQSGKALNLMASFSNFHTQTSVQKSIGLYSSSSVAPYTASLDGYRLHNDGTTVRFQVYNNGTAMVDKAQSTWNDPLDGTGASKMIADWSAMQVVRFEQLWLGANEINFWIIYQGKEYLVHSERFNNNPSITKPYTLTPNNPLKWSIRSTGGIGTFTAICATVGLDGVTNSVGLERFIDSGSANLAAAVVGTNYMALSIRLKSGFKSATVIPTAYSILNSASQGGKVSVLLNPTIAGVVTWVTTQVPNSAIEYAIGVATNIVTGGTQLGNSGHIDKQLSDKLDTQQLRSLGQAIDGTADVISLCVMPLTGINLNYYALLNYLETV